jgi:serine phosphatase RsbU (regulator of sigma subunit)/anti-sigma regulatory factor (Ser/Thr protein kinase)
MTPADASAAPVAAWGGVFGAKASNDESPAPVLIKMKRLPDSEPPLPSSERILCSVRTVLARATDVLWQADQSGAITEIIPCRPTLSRSQDELDETEVAQVEQLWLKAIRCAQRFSAVYHLRAPGNATVRNFLVQAVPVFDDRDEVRYWSGHATEVERFADAGTRFISEATFALSSSLNRAAIVNRFINTAVDQFADACAVHTFADDGSLRLEGFADRRAGSNLRVEMLAPAVEEAVRSKQPLLLLGGVQPAGEKLRGLIRDSQLRSLIVVPMMGGSGCIGALTMLESERLSSFAARELDVAAVVARLLAMTLENIKTFEREQLVTERFRFLARITEQLFETLDRNETLSLLLDGIVERFADYAIAATFSNGRLRVAARAGTTAELRAELEPELVAALQQRRSILNGFLKHGPLTEAARPLSWMMAPLFSGDAACGAILCCSNGRHYDAGDLELLDEIGRRASLALQHAESFARERRLIQTLQQATLPAQLARVEGASLSAIYRPASSDVQVGGDWYDAYPLDDHRVLLTVGDVTGHGLEASIAMGKLRHAINVVALYERNPARILDATERILLRRLPASIATAFVAIVDPRSGTISYANAGHPYPLLRRRDGSIAELEADGLPLGLRSEYEPSKAITERIDDVALLAFYTDGLTEATRDPLAGEQRLRQAIGSDAIFFVESSAQFVESFCLPDHSHDDVAILVLNFVRSQRWKFESRDWQAAKAARREFVECLESRATAESDVRGCELIFGELLANLAQHIEGPIEIALEWRTDDAVLHVIDRGTGYPASDRTESDLMTENGRGLWLLSRLGARLRVRNIPGFGTHVSATLPVRPTPLSS